jgi:hypothetical protein
MFGRYTTGPVDKRAEFIIRPEGCQANDMSATPGDNIGVVFGPAMINTGDVRAQLDTPLPCAKIDHYYQKQTHGLSWVMAVSMEGCFDQEPYATNGGSSARVASLLAGY